MDEPRASLLVIEDEPQLRRYLRATLSAHGYRLEEAPDGATGLRMAAAIRPDAVLLDLGLPDMDGLEVLRRLREWTNVPVIILSARGQEDDKVLALDGGADDYLTKPFGTGELLARIRAALRRFESGGTAAEPHQQWGDVQFDLSAREVRRKGEIIHLTPNEFDLLAILVRHAGKVLTHHQLLKEVWGGVAGAQPHYLRVYMAQLRRKLEDDPARPRHLLTELGVGYRLRLE